MTAKKSAITGKSFRGGGGEFFWLARVYTPGVCTPLYSKYGTMYDSNPIAVVVNGHTTWRSPIYFQMLSLEKQHNVQPKKKHYQTFHLAMEKISETFNY